jgi:hypothetical protein
MLFAPDGGKIAMVDCGHNSTTDWRPSEYIKDDLNRDTLDYLFLTNADQDHLSDLDGLWEAGIHVRTLWRNRSIDNAYLRGLKQQSGNLTNDMERYLQIDASYTHPVTEPFNDNMGGVTCTTYYNKYPEFKDTNDLSVAAFFNYGTFKILFPGDLEKASWKKLLERDDFCEDLADTTIFVASHHGRENGFCEDVFEFCSPRAVVISDRPIMYQTQETVPDYRNVIAGDGINVEGEDRRRHVLTTRRDGNIVFKVAEDGSFFVYIKDG